MTIKTRDEKFKDCFTVYMNNLEINDVKYHLDYNLTNKTRNKTRCVHEYKLEIFGSAESMFNTGENVVDILHDGYLGERKDNLSFVSDVYLKNNIMRKIKIETLLN